MAFETIWTGLAQRELAFARQFRKYSSATNILCTIWQWYTWQPYKVIPLAQSIYLQLEQKSTAPQTISTLHWSGESLYCSHRTTRPTFFCHLSLTPQSLKYLQFTQSILTSHSFTALQPSDSLPYLWRPLHANFETLSLVQVRFCPFVICRSYSR